MDDQRRFRPKDQDPPSEGVRIIGPDEAAESMDRPDVAPRRGKDEPRPGDRPSDPPEGPRPALRFPLDAAADPTRIERPPVDPAPEPVTGPVELPHWTEPATGEVPAVIVGDGGELLDDEDDDDAWSSFATSAPRWRDAGDDWDDDGYLDDLAEHSGETRIGALASDDDADAFDDFDDLDEQAEERRSRSRGDEAWSSADDLDWADDEIADEEIFEDWDDDDVIDEPTRDVTVVAGGDDDVLSTGELAAIEADDARLAQEQGDWDPEAEVDGDLEPDEDGAADESGDAYDDGYDEAGGGNRDGDGGLAARFRPVESGDGERDMTTAVGVGVALGAVALVALLISPALMVGLITVALGLAALEWFNVLDNAEWESAGLIGIGACVALPLAIYWRGPAFYPMLLFIVFAAILAWFLVGAGGRDPRVLEGSMSTLFGVIWIGGFGSSAAGILALPDGRWLLLAAILATVAYDVGGLFVGRYLGQRSLSAASPSKTVEGLVGGMVMAFAITIVTIGIAGLGPWDGFSAVLVLGLGSAAAAPLGDLTQSLLKRDLGIKDMGSVLPGHGGLLDRFDSLLFVLPTVLWLTVAVGGF